MILVGHRFFEVRKPNIIANLKTIIFEPALVVFEILSFIGYKSNIEEWKIIVDERNKLYLEGINNNNHGHRD